MFSSTNHAHPFFVEAGRLKRGAPPRSRPKPRGPRREPLPEYEPLPLADAYAAQVEACVATALESTYEVHIKPEDLYPNSQGLSDDVPQFIL